MNIIETEIKRCWDRSAETCRLFHGRGQCFPGFEDILIDWFDSVVFVTLYRRRSSSWLEMLTAMLQRRIPGLSAIVAQQRYLKDSPIILLSGFLPDKVFARESGLKYYLNLNEAQNIGFFPDMSMGRTYVRGAAQGKKVLNLFAYTCSFSVAAVVGGASQVINLDMNRNALARGKLNHQLNDLDSRHVSFLAIELFRSFSKLKKLAPFDLIICDPPGDQGSSFCAQRDWPRLARKLPALLAPGGVLMICVSSPHVSSAVLKGLFCRTVCPQLRMVKSLTAGDSFPERDTDKGCRVFFYQLESESDNS